MFLIFFDALLVHHVVYFLLDPLAQPFDKILSTIAVLHRQLFDLVRFQTIVDLGHLGANFNNGFELGAGAGRGGLATLDAPRALA